MFRNRWRALCPSRGRNAADTRISRIKRRWACRGVRHIKITAPELHPVVKSMAAKMLSLFSIALHNRDSPTDVIPRPGHRTHRHASGPSAASPFGTRCLAFDVRTLVGRASIFHMKLLVLYTLICACQGVICVFNAKSRDNPRLR